MKFSNRLSFAILATGLTVLIISSIMLYKFSYSTIINSQFMHTKSIADEISDDINFLLFEKVKTALTLANTPIIIKALETSNLSYSDLSAEKRKESIKRLNEKWASTRDPADNFILRFTDNKVSAFLKNQQSILKGEYGEIFLTNKFGALVASTGKLSTLAHGHKYWWLGAYHNGEGKIFIDDRGYDDSVSGYVLGLVVPIRKGREIIGVLKCNLNILGSISELISGEKNQLLGKLKLVRSGGMVVFEEGFEPLSTKVHRSIFEKLKSKKSGTFIINDSGEKYIVGCSEIELTKGGEGYGFGGTFESIDHKKGNTGESWYVVCSRQMSVALMPFTKSIKTIVLIGIAIILILVFVAYLIGRKIANPLSILNKATEKIGKGDFEYRIGVTRKDEFGNLAESFNNMASKLQQTTTSLELLENEAKQRRKVEEGFKESEIKYRQTFETNMAVKLMIDPESGAILEANEAACNYYGYSRREMETLKISDINALPPEEIHSEMQKAKREERLYFTFPHRLASGEIRNVEVYSGPVNLGEKTVLYSIIHDVTDRIEAEKRIRENEEKYKNLVEESFDGIFIQKGPNIIFTNKRLNEMLGYEDGELIGRNHWLLYHPDYQKLTRERAQARMRREEVVHRYEVKLQRKDGTCFYGEINARVITFPSIEESGIQVWVKDINESKQAEEALRESEEKYRLLVENQTDLLVKVDREGKFQFVSPSYCRLFGKTEDELLSETFMPLVHPDDQESTVKEMKKLYRPPHTAYIEQRAMTKDGWTWLAWLDTAVLDEEGNVTEIIGLGRDITDKKQAEAERERLQSQLQQAQKMESVGTLAGGIAHDFNNILAIILGNAELAIDDIPDFNPASESLKGIHRASIRAKDMVQQLLAFSRKSEEESKPLNMSLSPIIKESMKMLRSAIPTSVEFKQHVSDDPCNILGDPVQINQIMMNLVTNAADAMSEEGGLLEVTLEKMMLQEEKFCFDWVLPPGAYVRLKVRDTGEGMSPEIMARVFDPYYTRKEVGKGTGMGLSVVHGIVKRHGGGIRVESEPGKGTLFEIYFPALEKAAPEEKEPEGEIKGGSERILFVDDEESMVSLNRQRLERLGYVVKSTTKPVEALEWFRANPDQFDVIITDMSMPKMTGDKLAKAILAIRPHMPVIICTGYSERISEKKAAALGARKYIEKPIENRNLASALREVLDEK